jgi:hypothetical protein
MGEFIGYILQEETLSQIPGADSVALQFFTPSLMLQA